jgi:hypothetical protein
MARAAQGTAFLPLWGKVRYRAADIDEFIAAGVVDPPKQTKPRSKRQFRRAKRSN